MKNMKKKKALLLTLLSSMAMAASAVAIVFSSGERFAGISATTQVPGSIVFSRETGEFTKIDSNTASVSGRTANGATYYAVSHNNEDITDSNYVAVFGGGGSDTRYVSFSTSPTGSDDFEFQRITGIKVKLDSDAPQTMYIQWSTNGTSFGSSESFKGSSNPEKHTLSSPQRYVRLVGNATYARKIVSLELFYECASSDPDPEQKEVDHLAFGSMKSSYVLGDEFEEPEVIAYYTDSTHETVAASFSPVDMTVTGKQSVTASYGGVDKNFTIEVWPSATACRVSYKGLFLDDYEETETSSFLKSSAILPEYGEPSQTVSFVPTMKDAYIYVDSYDESESVTFSFDGTTASFTMPNFDIEIHIVYQSNPYKAISYVGFDLGSYDSAATSVFLDGSSTVPSYAEPGDTVSVTPVAKSGYVIDGVVDMNDDVTINENAGVYSFTMPNYAFEVTILFHEVITLESIYVVSPKTTYTVGSSFVIPTVKGVYSNDAEETLEVALSNFSGFDSSVAVASQTITVSYPGVSSVSYTIEVIEGEEPQTLNCTYRIAQSSTTDYKLQFNSDGTGRYYRYYNSTESWIINFTYTYNSSTGEVSIELDHSVTYSQVNNFATGYRMVQANSASGVIYYVNDSGFINSSNEFEIDMVRVSAGVFSTDHRVFTLA